MTTITEATVRELAGFRSQDAPVISCYLDVDGKRYVRPRDVEAELESLLRTAREQVDGSAEADFRRIEAYVRQGFDRSSTRGLAIFSCAAHDLWHVVPLPVSPTSRIVVNAAPAVGQLEALVQELERFGVLLVDRQRARMFAFSFGELIDHSELFDAMPRDYDRLGMRDTEGRDKAEHHVEELVVQHLRNAAAVAFRVFQEHDLDRLSVGAPDDIAPTVESLLHPYLRERLAPRIDVSATARVEEVRRAALEVEGDMERQHERSVVARLREAVARGTRGVAGLNATLWALVERRVETLVVSEGFAESGWRCGLCGHLCRVGPRCPLDGAQMEHLDDVVEEAVQAAFSQSCRVEVCVGNADLDVLGRIGALLRY